MQGSEFVQSVYNCTLRLRGSLLHTVPLERVTRDELKLLAFMHGVESIPGDEIKALGKKPVADIIDEDGTVHYVTSQEHEYRRLARKYDQIVNSGRGKKLVETCFNTTLVDFGAVIDAVDPLVEMDRRALEAEAKTAISEAESVRAAQITTLIPDPTPAPIPVEPAPKPMGSSVFARP